MALVCHVGVLQNENLYRCAAFLFCGENAFRCETYKRKIQNVNSKEKHQKNLDKCSIPVLINQ